LYWSIPAVNFWAWTSSSGSMLARSAALSCFHWVLFRGYLPVTGDAIWPEILATPTWHPATGMPTRRLLIKRGDAWEPKTEIIGPGYLRPLSPGRQAVTMPNNFGAGAPSSSGASLRSCGS
jgi:hypothetical protein